MSKVRGGVKVPPRPKADPKPKQKVEPPSAEQVLATALNDHKLTDSEWKEQVAPALARQPEGGAGFSALLEVYGDKANLFGSEAATGVALALEGAGYSVSPRDDGPLKRDVGVQAAREGNVAEADLTFERLMRQSGGTQGELRIAVVDGGFAANDLLDDNVDAKSAKAPEGQRIGVSVGSFTAAEREEGPRHGTHVAGIATRGTSLIKASLVAVPLEAQGDLVEGAAKKPPQKGKSNLFRGIEKAISSGAKVINVSIETFVTPAEAREYERLMKKNPGVLFVFGAGNDRYELGSGPPAALAESVSLPNLAVVGASHADGGRWGQSNYGKTRVDLAARGAHVFSADDRGGMRYESGTSMATPNVSNLAAKCLLLDPSLTPPQLKALLAATSDAHWSWKDANAAGGTVNGPRAMTAAALGKLMKGGASLAEAANAVGVDVSELPRYRVALGVT